MASSFATQKKTRCPAACTAFTYSGLANRKAGREHQTAARLAAQQQRQRMRTSRAHWNGLHEAAAGHKAHAEHRLHDPQQSDLVQQHKPHNLCLASVLCRHYRAGIVIVMRKMCVLWIVALV